MVFVADSLVDLCPKSLLKKTVDKLIDNAPEVRLGADGQSAALVHQSWNSSSFKRFEECVFSVNANDWSKNKRRGLYVSIRKLNLRKSPSDEGCIDHVSFKFHIEKPKKYCGRLTSSPADLRKTFFAEAGGHVKVKISIDKMVPLKKLEDTLDIEILFTAFEGKTAGLHAHAQANRFLISRQIATTRKARNAARTRASRKRSTTTAS